MSPSRIPVASLILLTLATAVLGNPPLKSLTEDQKRELDRARAIHDAAKKHLDQGRLDQAYPAILDPLGIRTKYLGTNHPDTAATWHLLGVLYLKQRDFQLAQATLEVALEVRRAVLGEEHLDTATTLSFLGEAEHLWGAHDKARTHLTRALEIRQKHLREPNYDTAISHGKLGLFLMEQREFPAARTHLEQALAQHKHDPGEQSAVTAAAYSRLAQVLEKLGEFDAPRDHWERALKIRSRAQGPKHLDLAIEHTRLGELFESFCQPEAARQQYESALAIHRKVSGETSDPTAESLARLARSLADMGDVAAARKSLDQALQIRRALSKAETEPIAALHCQIGSLLIQQGDYAAARTSLDQSLEIRKELPAYPKPDFTSSYRELARLLQQQGCLGPAYEKFQLTQISSKLDHGEHHPRGAWVLNDFSLLLLDSNETVLSKRWLEESLAAFKKEQGETSSSYRTVLGHLGIVHQAEGRVHEARTHYEEALRILARNPGEIHPVTARLWNNLGVVCSSQDDYALARQHLERANSARQKIFGEGHSETSETLQNLAILEFLEGHPQAALRDMDRAVRSLVAYTTRVLPGLSESEQHQFQLYKLPSRIALALSLSANISNEPGVAAASAEWVLNMKGIGLPLLARQEWLLHHPSDARQVALASELNDVRRRLALTTMSAAGTLLDRRSMDVYRLDLSSAELTRKLANASASSAKAGEWIRLESVRQKLDKEEMLIEFIRYQGVDLRRKGTWWEWARVPHYAAWIVPPAGSGDVQLVGLGPADVIDKAIAQVRGYLPATAQSLDKVGEPEAVRGLRKSLDEATRLLWTPLAGRFQSPRRLVLCPDESLWLFPWNAIPVGEDRYLVEDMSIRFLTSGRELLNTDTDSSSAAPSIFADPDFDLPAASVLAGVRGLRPDPADPGAAPLDVDLPRVSTGVRRVPGTAGEAQAVLPNVEKFAGGKARLHLGAEALESTVKVVNRPRMLMLSTHGFFLYKQSGPVFPGLDEHGGPPYNTMLCCGLLFAGCNGTMSAGGDDGILTGLEIRGMNLHGTDLVVLSACDTGVGYVRNGEGVAGLRQAFQLAGAKSVVATLWQIPDAESARLMNDFFISLAAGQPKAEALRLAQIKRITARRERFGAAHPYYWAAYTLTGQ